MDPLDPAWAAIIGTGVGALSTALGSAIGPIVKDAIQRRATRADSVNDARRRISLDLLEALDAFSNASVDDIRELKVRMDRLRIEGSLLDKNGAFSDLVLHAQLSSMSEHALVKNMVGSYFQHLIQRWARDGSVPPSDEYMAMVRRTNELALEIAEREEGEEH